MSPCCCLRRCRCRVRDQPCADMAMELMPTRLIKRAEEESNNRCDAMYHCCLSAGRGALTDIQLDKVATVLPRQWLNPSS